MRFLNLVLIMLMPWTASAESDLPLHISESMKPGKAYVRVLSYNVKGLPSIINSYPKSRFAVIGQMLKERRRTGNAPDVVLLQEAFINPTLAIQKESGYPYVARGPTKEGVSRDGDRYKKLLNSGLYIMSEHKIVRDETMAFPKDMCRKADCYANKGAQLIQIRVRGIPFPLTITNTHAQAHEKYDSTRDAQYPLLKSFFRRHASFTDDYGAMLFGGDYNTCQNRPSYPLLKELLDSKNAGEVCLRASSGCRISSRTPTEWVLEKSQDHILYRSGRKVRIRPVSLDRGMNEKHKGKQLSDHLGYEVLFEVSWE